MKSKIVLPVMAIGIIAIATAGSVGLASAQQSESGRETLISRIAARFGLNEAEVEETFHEFKSERNEERHKRMQEKFGERLEQGVEDGNLTEDQMFAMLEKHEELEGRFDDLHDLSPEEMREAKADMHEEMEAWAQENDIDMEDFGRFKGEAHGKGKKFMHRK